MRATETVRSPRKATVSPSPGKRAFGIGSIPTERRAQGRLQTQAVFALVCRLAVGTGSNDGHWRTSRAHDSNGRRHTRDRAFCEIEERGDTSNAPDSSDANARNRARTLTPSCATWFPGNDGRRRTRRPEGVPTARPANLPAEVRVHIAPSRREPSAGVRTSRRFGRFRPGFLLAIASQPVRLAHVMAVVPRYRCGAALDSHQIPNCFANYQM